MVSVQSMGDVAQVAFPTGLPRVTASEQVGGATVPPWPVVDNVLALGLMLLQM